jgi:hypothetical protein
VGWTAIPTSGIADARHSPASSRKGKTLQKSASQNNKRHALPGRSCDPFKKDEKKLKNPIDAMKPIIYAIGC